MYNRHLPFVPHVDLKAAFTPRPAATPVYKRQRAVRLLTKSSLEFEYIDIYDKGLSKQDISERIKQPVQTMPQILHGDHYVGGCTELFAYLK